MSAIHMSYLTNLNAGIAEQISELEEFGTRAQSATRMEQLNSMTSDLGRISSNNLRNFKMQMSWYLTNSLDGKTETSQGEILKQLEAETNESLERFEAKIDQLSIEIQQFKCKPDILEQEIKAVINQEKFLLTDTNGQPLSKEARDYLLSEIVMPAIQSSVEDVGCPASQAAGKNTPALFMARFISKFKKSTSSKGQSPKKTFKLTNSSEKLFGYENIINHVAGTYTSKRDHTPLIKALVRLVGFVVISSQAPGFVRNLMKGDGNPSDTKGDGKCTDIIESLKEVGENPADYTDVFSNSGCKWGVNDKNNGAGYGNKKGGNERKITTPKNKAAKQGPKPQKVSPPLGGVPSSLILA